MLFFKRIQKFAANIVTQIFFGAPSSIEIHKIENFPSKKLNRKVTIEIFLPPNYYSTAPSKYPFVFFNDGQDMKGLGMASKLENLYIKKQIKPIVVIAIHAGNRLQEYGVASQLDYKGRGKLAGAYTKFINKELIPFLRLRYSLSEHPEDAVFAGFSMGGLSGI